ncbi:MAG: radical SAM protein [Candidatus Aegiribacteria sp.]|nr:radical SAM protein [Candidatus Aegiribacteria sp.]
MMACLLLLTAEAICDSEMFFLPERNLSSSSFFPPSFSSSMATTSPYLQMNISNLFPLEKSGMVQSWESISFEVMKYLVTAPPVFTPSEPPSGAFLLAAGLCARGEDAGFLDLSLEYFLRILSDSPEGRGNPPVRRALDYLLNNRTYSPHRHRTACGILNARLKQISAEYPGWRISLMDAVPPVAVHRPGAIRKNFLRNETPFSGFWEEYLLPKLKDWKPETVLVSISYLSQLPAAVELTHFLRRHQYRVIAGGSLLNSIARTGRGLQLISEVMPEIATGDGSSFPGFSIEDSTLLRRLSWPKMMNSWKYITGRPVIPFPLTTGCYWNRCLFCPDSGRELNVVGSDVFSDFISTAPEELMKEEPVVHLLDSAVPEKQLGGFLPAARRAGVDFYTFARPEPWLGRMIDELAESGCLMLQLGLESGSKDILDRFHKGISPEVSLKILERSSKKGIRTYAYMLAGLPGETEKDYQLTLDFLQSAGDSIDFINFSIFNLPETCLLTARADDLGLELVETGIPEDAIKLYQPFLYGGTNPRVDARRFISDLVTEINTVSRALRRTPKWFRTSHFPLISIPGRNN